MICTSSCMPRMTSTPTTHHTHTMHHLFFPFSASVILLSLAFFFPPISTLHLWFTILYVAIAFLFLSFEIMCVKALVGMGVWEQRFVYSVGHVWWCFMVIRKNQIAIITRFWLFLGKNLARAKCTDVMREYCGLLPKHCWCSDLTCFMWLLGCFISVFLCLLAHQKHLDTRSKRIFDKNVRLKG